MPQSTKNSAGGKSHPEKSQGGGGKSKASDDKQGKTASPTGPQRKGEKKTTP